MKIKNLEKVQKQIKKDRDSDYERIEQSRQSKVQFIIKKWNILKEDLPLYIKRENHGGGKSWYIYTKITDIHINENTRYEGNVVSITGIEYQNHYDLINKFTNHKMYYYDNTLDIISEEEFIRNSNKIIKMVNNELNKQIQDDLEIDIEKLNRYDINFVANNPKLVEEYNNKFYGKYFKLENRSYEDDINEPEYHSYVYINNPITNHNTNALTILPYGKFSKKYSNESYIVNIFNIDEEMMIEITKEEFMVEFNKILKK